MIKEEHEEDEGGSGKDLECSLVLWGGQWGATSRLRADLGQESQGSTQASSETGWQHLPSHSPLPHS